MAQFKTDIQDISFDLFDYLKIQDQIADFDANDLKDILRQFDHFVEKEMWPTREAGDREGVRLEKDGVKVPECFKETHHSFYENGWFALGYPEEIGGMPVPEPLALACTSIANGANVALSMYVALSRAALNVIHQVGSQEQKEKYIPKIMEGAWGGTMCLTEAGAGSDVGAAKTTASPYGDGTYKIQGTKVFISSGESDLYENNIHLVLARTPNSPEGTKGLSLFIVPRYRINDDGSSGESNHVACTKIEEKMGIHGSSTCEMTFGNDGECLGEMIGKEHEGIVNMFIMMNEARLYCGVQGESQANLAYLLTDQYARERSQFGKEIIQHPDVKRMMLKMRAMSRGMRILDLYAAHLIELEKQGDEKASQLIALLTPICKAFCSDEGFQTCVDAVQVHGGYGYCSEYGIEQFVRDTKIATIYEGTNGIQAIDFVMRKILKDQAKSFGLFSERITQTLKEAPTEWAQEVDLLRKSLSEAEKLIEKFGQLASRKKMNSVLLRSTDFLQYCGNIFVAWLLLDSAILAKKKAGSGEGDAAYLQTKQDDFVTFAQHYLIRNEGIFKSLQGFEKDISAMEV